MAGKAAHKSDSNSNRKSKEPTASRSSTPAPATRRKAKKAITPVQNTSIASSQANDPTGKGKPNIRWSSELLEQLANCIACDYAVYKTASKIGYGRTWSKEIGVGNLDSSGERTKAKAASMISEWTETYEWSMSTGNGDKMIDGRMITLTEQCIHR